MRNFYVTTTLNSAQSFVKPAPNSTQTCVRPTLVSTSIFEIYTNFNANFNRYMYDLR